MAFGLVNERSPSGPPCIQRDISNGEKMITEQSHTESSIAAAFNTTER